MDRRKFLESAGRWGIIGLLALITGIFIKRNTLSLDPDCDPRFCQDCGKSKKCDQFSEVSYQLSEKE